MRRKVLPLRSCAVDGVYAFRLAALREKWEKIVRYVPAGFSTQDLKKFCAFLSGESTNKIYLKGSLVKVELGLCRGKEQRDKRETIKRRDAEREMARAIKEHNARG